MLALVNMLRCKLTGFEVYAVKLQKIGVSEWPKMVHQKPFLTPRLETHLEISPRKGEETLLGLGCWFHLNRHIFANICAKNYFHISATVTWTFNLWTSQLLCQLLVAQIIFHINLNVVWFSFFQLTVGTGQTDRRTDGPTDRRTE